MSVWIENTKSWHVMRLLYLVQEVYNTADCHDSSSLCIKKSSFNNIHISSEWRPLSNKLTGLIYLCINQFNTAFPGLVFVFLGFAST